MIHALLLCLSLFAAPASPEAAAAASTPATEGPQEAKGAEPRPDAGGATAPAAAPDPEVKRAVDQMQRFYEETKDFTATFQQNYRHRGFPAKKASGTVRFKKRGGSMRWDYQKPDEKVFVISGKKIYTYDKEAKQLTVASVDTDRLSASITFLWGQGKLEREFNIRKADRKDLTGGIALELIPKAADPRFREVFFLLDPKTYAVKESLVVDPDGSENRVAFVDVKANTGFSDEVFQIEHPKDTQIIRLDGSPAGP